MKKFVFNTLKLSLLIMMYFSSCYNNKEDITILPKVSFLGEVVPIMTSGGCGCHNNAQSNSTNNNAVPFTHFDTIKDGTTIIRINNVVDYGTIIARIDTMRLWANGTIGHPGGGIIDLTENQREIIKSWIDQGPPYDGGSAACDASGNITYTKDIVPIYNVTCKSAGCHGGRGPVLDYAKLTSDKSILTAMMASGGSNGHPAGRIGLTSCTVDKFKAWIAAGQPR
ncbi:MAG: hypothetical protein KA109_06875 [Saprospiraceae bacterium]|jgi:hypothetical protein|nr:hypothetical protein [Saprospiraceae bacterium]MBK6480220.1 hypothetical protein [Saprospiraceae bacterium]MBK6814926.1 hypothetical protein [Saprospiraceae bacterium]MBK7371965.1 hypothetical protein [Saprospiraceae bacterium]MBK7435570.1 hypothetical protein [Saprospiraceae bacterium]